MAPLKFYRRVRHLQCKFGRQNLTTGTIPDEPWWYRLQFDIHYQRQPSPCKKTINLRTQDGWRIDDYQPSTSNC